jgi:hypothetical protein
MSIEAKMDNLFGEMIRGIVEANVAGIQAGADAADKRMAPAIRALEREFFAAMVDPDTKMKSSLQVEITNVLAMCPSGITDKVNEYASRKIKDDQLSRYEGRPDHDLTTRNTRIA